MAYRKIKEICKPFSSSILINKMKNDNGDYPLWGAKGLVKKISTYQQDKPYISIVKWGAGVGRVEIRPEKTSIVATMQGILPNSDIDIRWLCNALRYLHLENFATKATVPNLYFRDYGEAVIRVPDTEEQKFISSVLEKIEIDIDKKKHIIDRLDNLIKARFVEMFDDNEYPKTTISEMLDNKISTAKKDFSSTDEIKYIDISSIDNKHKTLTGFTNYTMVNAPSRAQQHVRKGDILVSTVRPNLKNIAIVPYDDKNLVASSGFCVLRSIKCKPTYLMAVVCSEDFTNAMTRVVTGANYPAIKNSDVLNYLIPIPPIQKQEEFDSIVAQVDKSKFTNLRPTTNLHHAIYFLCATFTFA